MTATLFGNLAIFLLSLLVGFEVISKIPSTLHTPMMSGANAIHGVVVVGAIITASLADSPAGYAVTDRMLAMFTRRPAPAAPPIPAAVPAPVPTPVPVAVS
jgi:H+-translocating NAD(P) transhydrogenase subunit alpha